MEGNPNSRSDPHSDFLVEFIYGSRKFKVLVLALAMGIFDEIDSLGSGEWVSDRALAESRGFDVDNTRRLLNTLAAIKVLDRGTTIQGRAGNEHLYRNTIGVSRYLLRSSGSNGLVALMFLEETLMPLFLKNLPHVIKHGSVEQFPRLLWKGGYPQDNAFLALPDFAVSARRQYFNSEGCQHSRLQPAAGPNGNNTNSSAVGHPPPGALTLCPPGTASNMQMARELFLSAWDGMQAQCLTALLTVFNLRQYTTIVDLGGGSGRLAWSIVQAHPHICATVFDTPRIIESVPKPFCINQNLRFLKGDFFNDLLPEADCYILSHVLRDYDDEKVCLLLGRVNKVVNPGGSVLVMEKVVQDDRRAPLTALLDDLLAAAISRGRERSQSEYVTLLEATGFRHVQHKRILGVNMFDVLLAKKCCQ